MHPAYATTSRYKFCDTLPFFPENILFLSFLLCLSDRLRGSCKFFYPGVKIFIADEKSKVIDCNFPSFGIIDFPSCYFLFINLLVCSTVYTGGCTLQSTHIILRSKKQYFGCILLIKINFFQA
jgi:hypothetical protein